MRYLSSDEDSARWNALPLRQGDLVVCSRSKHGTTWLQTVLLLLIHRQPDLPAPLAWLSPWIDHLAEPVEAVVSRLAAQPHRRVIKTHTPLDGVPLHDAVTYLVVARHPLDAALSLYHQGSNIQRDRLRRLTGAPPAKAEEPRPEAPAWLARWIRADADAVRHLDSLPGVMRHLAGAWSRRLEANVVLVHYDDLLADLEGRMRALAGRLNLEPPTPELVRAATFEQMQANADRLAPDAAGILRDRTRFFRHGRSGAGRRMLASAELEAYERRAAMLAPDDLLRWLHRPPPGGG